MIAASMIADSLSPMNKRLPTMQLVYPRFIHSEFMTHRVFSRNASSSRAIPVKRMLQYIQDTPAMPVEWGLNKPGMQAGELASSEVQRQGEAVWLQAMGAALAYAEELADLGFHKQIVNRITEPFAHITVIVTGTEWENFYKLRRHPAAQPEIRELADRMFECMENSTPTVLTLEGRNSWHVPYVRPQDWKLIEDWAKTQFQINTDANMREYGNLDSMVEHTVLMVSAARCARVSYLNHDGSEPDFLKDIALAKDLSAQEHWSPFEHQATPVAPGHREQNANLNGFVSFRTLTELHEEQKAEMRKRIEHVENIAKRMGATFAGLGESAPDKPIVH